MTPVADPFEVLGLPAEMALDERDLERRYLRLSRECHPDHQAAGAAGDVAVLEQSARINDAYRTLRDPWLRARALIERAAPQALKKAKDLCPIFLMDALEQAEAVAHAVGAERQRLRAEVEQALAACRQALQHHIERGEWEDAATALHESRYHRKALHDLDETP